MTFNLAKALIHQGIEQGSRSNVIKPLIAIILCLILAIAIADVYNAPGWFKNCLMVSFLLVLLLFLLVYIYLLFTDKDSLRSEKFNIQKLVIEKGLVGDNITGLFDINNENALKELPYGSASAEESKK